jgi:DnaD/phage-associated family protein
MNATVIIMAVGYAVSRNKYSMRYIEKVLLGWQDEGITTIDAADEHLRLLEQTDIAAEKVRTLLGRAKELDARQRQMAHTWMFVWQFSDEMIALALEKAKTKAGAVIPYAHKVLAGWYEENITDVAAANKETESKTPAARRGKTEATSLDVKGYESMLEDYVPTIPRKE